MKNGSLPAMPIELSGFGQFASEAYTGLTKREMFAMAAMQGLIASDTRGTLHEKRCAELAVKQADALLAELDRTK